MTDEPRQLTAKQQVFVREYLIDLNATQAALRAGYSEDTAKQIGYENLTKPYIRDMVNKALELRAQRAEITADYVVTTIQDTIERCRQVKPVLDKGGHRIFCETETGEMAAAYTFDAGNVLKGTEQLGRHLKLFTDKQEIDNNLNISIGSKDADTL